ncbi:acriflavin resistance protein [Nonlabens ulvanivorans]|uniref:Acriflavin resistance protein n=1 Tax=Nonlabens ulvanivorans TaxID=906888 RepID=A0A090QH80_NONUL|nr:acriflavin resistance protein [Nonlabens ulvanivorans]
MQQNQPIYLKQVAQIIDGPEVPQSYVSLGFGQGSDKKPISYLNIQR